MLVFNMKLSGSYQINLEKQKVWEALNDPEILKKTIPGCEEFKKNSDTEFSATATNKIGPFNASFTGNIELKDLNPPHSYKISGSGNSPVGFASGEAEVKLENENGGGGFLPYPAGIVEIVLLAAIVAAIRRPEDQAL